MRTGEFLRIELADVKTALTRKPWVNGMCFVKPRKRPDRDDHDRDEPGDERARRPRCSRDACLLGSRVPSARPVDLRDVVVACPGCPGTLPMTGLARRA